MKSVTANQLLIWILLVFIGVWSYCYYFVFDVEEITRHKGYSKEAQRNPFLAAHLFLSEFGVESEYFNHYGPLSDLTVGTEKQAGSQSSHISLDDTVVLLNAHGTLNGELFYSLWDWMDAGGTLVLSLENPFMGEHRKDEFAEALGVGLKKLAPMREYPRSWDAVEEKNPEDSLETVDIVETPTEQHDADNKDLGAEASTDLEGSMPGGDKRAGDINKMSDQYACAGGKTTLVEHFSAEAPIQLRFGRGQYFSVEEDYVEWVVDERHYDDKYYHALAKYFIGSGEVYVLRSTQLWKNKTIQCHDNAYFLSQLVKPGAKVWFIENHEAPSLFELLKSNLFSVILACMILVTFILWRSVVRYGPIVSNRSTSRRRFSEHIFASTLFIWRMRGSGFLLSLVRKNLETILKTKNYQYEQLPVNEKVRYIKQYTDIEAEKIHFALFSETGESVNEFSESIKILKQLKGEL